ncbi:hypothetical protein [Burkholderia ubonensis]|uniref:hypothetical protein n=1 Tax=Burkholderia ubonensis TaxID=101571 RepID=UPI0012F73138|nr:hypothetical protein [Burkholderia ubonensis]
MDEILVNRHQAALFSACRRACGGARVGSPGSTYRHADKHKQADKRHRKQRLNSGECVHTSSFQEGHNRSECRASLGLRFVRGNQGRPKVDEQNPEVKVGLQKSCNPNQAFDFI